MPDRTVEQQVFKVKGLSEDAAYRLFWLIHSGMRGEIVPGLYHVPMWVDDDCLSHTIGELHSSGLVKYSEEDRNYLLVPSIFAGKARIPYSLGTLKAWNDKLKDDQIPKELINDWKDALLTASKKWKKNIKFAVGKVFQGKEEVQTIDPSYQALNYFAQRYQQKYGQKYIADFSRVYRTIRPIVDSIGVAEWNIRVNNFMEDEFFTKHKSHSIDAFCRNINRFGTPQGSKPNTPKEELSEYHRILQKRKQAKVVNGSGNS